MLLMVHVLYAKKKPPVPPPFAYVDQKALQMPDSMTHSSESIARYVKENFTSNTDRARAIFIWIATNISYDIDNMFAINFDEKKEDIIAKPLQLHRGICSNYAALFTDICTKAGIPTYEVVGYTKQNGFADYIPHAWCAAYIDTAWYMFDPTWGSGYCSNGHFYRQINEDYFKASPWTFLHSHMPFDPMWEFVDYPVTNEEFYNGRTMMNPYKEYFNFKDSIAAYDRADTITKLTGAAYRINKNGLKNTMIFQMLANVKIQIENAKRKMQYDKEKAEFDRQAAMVDLYNKAANKFTDGAALFNLFINYRNAQFAPLKPDAQIQAMIDTTTRAMDSASLWMGQVKDPPANILPMMDKLGAAIAEARTHISEQQKFLKDYFSRPRRERKYAFYTKVNMWGGN